MYGQRPFTENLPPLAAAIQRLFVCRLIWIAPSFSGGSVTQTALSIFASRFVGLMGLPCPASHKIAST